MENEDGIREELFEKHHSQKQIHIGFYTFKSIS